ncbi:hypothetical protein GCM10025777_29260 [Membranihabitans marinus]
MQAMKNYIIHDQENLLKLISKEKINFNGKIKMNIGQLSQDENAQYEKYFNEYYNACGCEMGSFFCFVSILLYSIFEIFHNDNINWLTVRNGVIIFFLSAGLGKIIGIFIAKMRLKKEVTELLHRLQ